MLHLLSSTIYPQPTRTNPKRNMSYTAVQVQLSCKSQLNTMPSLTTGNIIQGSFFKGTFYVQEYPQDEHIIAL